MGAMVDILRCGSFSGEKRLFEFPDVSWMENSLGPRNRGSYG